MDNWKYNNISADYHSFGSGDGNGIPSYGLQYEWPSCFITGIVDLKGNTKEENIREACALALMGWGLVNLSTRPVNFGIAMAKLSIIVGGAMPENLMLIANNIINNEKGLS